MPKFDTAQDMAAWIDATYEGMPDLVEVHVPKSGPLVAWINTHKKNKETK